MDSKSKRGIKTGIATSVIAIAVLAAFIIPASATTNGCPLETKYYDTINGGIYFQTSIEKPDGWMKNPLTATFDNVPDKSKIKVARLYTGVWGGSPSKGGNYTIEVNGISSPKYYCCDPCPQLTGCDPWQAQRCDALNATCNAPHNVPSGKIRHYVTGCNVNFISYDVFDEMQTGTNTAKVTTEGNSGCTGGAWTSQGTVYLIALLVVYEDPNLPEITYWINEGAPYLSSVGDCSGNANEIFNYFNGTRISNPATLTYWTLGFPNVANASELPEYTRLNGNDIGMPDYMEEFGDYEAFYRWDNIPVSYLNPSPSSNLFKYYDPAAHYERVYSAVIMLQPPINESDLTVTGIEFPDAMRPYKEHTINATIKNMYNNTGGAFNVSLYANGVLNGTVNVPEMSAGESRTVSFEHVNLSYGCYEFRVFADSGGVIDEFSEDNNNRTDNYQVGYAVVVKSNSDFDDLVGDTKLPANSVTYDSATGTYYIQNLTIENCAGKGILIENTNVPFVITNCTLQECTGSGVYLHSVKNGKIKDSIAKDNPGKGIRLVNSNHVDIANSFVQNNSEYGIDVYPETMPTVDCEYINITNNTVEKENLYGIELYGTNCIVKDNIIRNSTGYGIFVSGDYNEMHNNTIKYSGDYGLKMDHSPTHSCLWNCIFGNTFVDNNIDFPGRTSQGYDNGDNYWNSTVKLGYYNDTSAPFDNYMGNYWSDYGGVDANNDKIGDDVYDIDGGTMNDTSPLMASWENYKLIVCGDVNCNDAINIGDMLLVRRHWLEGTPLCSEWAGDVNCNDAINIGDMLLVRRHWLEGTPLNCYTGCA